MKISKKIVAVVMVLGIIISGMMPFHGRVSRAAGYTSAVALPMNGVWSSERYITETDDEHWYKLTIPSDGALNLRMMSYINNYVYYTIYSRDLSNEIAAGSIWGASETSPETFSHNLVLSAGVYYCKINSYYTGKYKLYAQFNSYGVNDIGADSYDSPFLYQMGSTITGALTRTDGEDWYKISIPSDGYYTQKVISYFDYMEWTLYNWDLSNEISSVWISDGSETAPETATRDYVLSKGIYYVKIHSWRRDRGKYLFQFSKLTQENCSHEYQSTTHYATYFKRGYTSYRCKKCGHTYKEDYTPVRKLGQGYVYSYSYTGKGKMILSWSTISDASGYQIRYSRNRKMKGATIKTIRGQSKSKKTIKKLSRRKRYFVQVRPYKKSGGKTVYGKWSPKRSLKTR